LEETSSASSPSNATNNSQPPTSPSNGVTQDPLKSSVYRRQNSSDNVPNTDAKESQVTTPNRSDDDKGLFVYIQIKLNLILNFYKI
jgi:hypothetical protein